MYCNTNQPLDISKPIIIFLVTLKLERTNLSITSFGKFQNGHMCPQHGQNCPCHGQNCPCHGLICLPSNGLNCPTSGQKYVIGDVIFSDILYNN